MDNLEAPCLEQECGVFYYRETEAKLYTRVNIDSGWGLSEKHQ
jgi:hypothetical protein